MSDWAVHLEFEEGNSSKFWRARVEGKTLYVNYGKIGSAGQTQVKDFGDGDAAQRELDKLVKEKRKKGYVDSGGGGGGGEDEETVAEDEGEDVELEEEDDEEPPKKAVRMSAVTATGSMAAQTAKPTARMTLDAGSRKVETALYLQGNVLRMDSTETYATPEAAKKAYERLKKMLGGEGFKDS